MLLSLAYVPSLIFFVFVDMGWLRLIGSINYRSLLQNSVRKVSRYLQSRIRRHVPTRPLHVSHKLDVTSLQDPFATNLPKKMCTHLPFPTFLTSCIAILATHNQFRLSQRASHRTISLSDRGTPFFVLLAERKDCFTRLFCLPRFGAERLFHT